MFCGVNSNFLYLPADKIFSKQVKTLFEDFLHHFLSDKLTKINEVTWIKAYIENKPHRKSVASKDSQDISQQKFHHQDYTFVSISTAQLGCGLE